MTPEEYAKFQAAQIKAWDAHAASGEPPPHLHRPIRRNLWRAFVEWLRDDPERSEI